MATKQHPDPPLLLGIEAQLAQLIEGNRQLLELSERTAALLAEIDELVGLTG